jgi:hypothetical protein
LHGVLWRTVVDPVGGNSESERRTIPVVDPVLDVAPDQGPYFRDAVRQRSELAHRYLRDWNNESMHTFDVLGKMSQFSSLWRIFTCGHLEQLLNVEYPSSNLPFQIRTQVRDVADINALLELDFTFVGVVYRDTLDDRIPRVFRNPTPFDTQAYAQIRMFVPRRRLVHVPPSNPPPSGGTIGGIPGEPLPLPGPPGAPPPSAPSEPDELWMTVRQTRSWHEEQWDLLNQNWSLQLVPATSGSILEILSTSPGMDSMPTYTLPNMNGLSEADLQWLSHH